MYTAFLIEQYPFSVILYLINTERDHACRNLWTDGKIPVSCKEILRAGEKETMDIIKLILVFCVIVVVLWFKKPMWMAVIAASLAAIGLYGLSMHESLTAIYNGITSKSTIETLVVFYSITFLQRMMEKRKQLNNAQIAMNGLFNNNRINASLVPFLL